MDARRISIKCLYDKTDISQSIEQYFKAFSVREVLTGSADDADITLHDRESLWQGDWLPDRGTTLEIALCIAD